MIRISKVSKSYVPGTSSLSDVNLSVNKGEFVFLIGGSGSGKTTLLKLLYCEERPTSGHILINGKNIENLRRSEIPYLRRGIGVIFQDFKLLQERTIFENLAIPLEVSGVSNTDVKKKVQDVLKTVRIHHRMDVKVSCLSGGEQQKVAVGRAIINEPLILLADEPTGSLDANAGNEIIEILRSVNIKGTTILYATHNKSFVAGERAIFMEKGRTLN